MNRHISESLLCLSLLLVLAISPVSFECTRFKGLLTMDPDLRPDSPNP
jgi:hypothetical protein